MATLYKKFNGKRYTKYGGLRTHFATKGNAIKRASNWRKNYGMSARIIKGKTKRGEMVYFLYLRKGKRYIFRKYKNIKKNK